MTLALSISLPVQAQDTTGDPFLDAMLNDQKAAEEAEAQKAAATPAAKPAVESATPVAEARLTNPGAELSGVGAEVMERELGGNTGVLVNEQVYEGRQVKSVSIRYVAGKRVLPDSRLLDVVQTRAGSEYRSSRINDDLERLIKNGLVDGDARVAVEPTSGGVRVIFEVRPTSVMAGVGFTGNKRFTENKLRSILQETTAPNGKVTGTLRSGTAFNDQRLADARNAIIKAYNEAGYPDTKVTWRHSRTAREGYSDVVFDIKEGREVRMVSIQFEGNSAFDDEQLRQVMDTKERGLFTWFTKSGRVARERVEDHLSKIV